MYNCMLMVFGIWHLGSEKCLKFCLLFVSSSSFSFLLFFAVFLLWSWGDIYIYIYMMHTGSRRNRDRKSEMRVDNNKRKLVKWMKTKKTTTTRKTWSRNNSVEDFLSHSHTQITGTRYGLQIKRNIVAKIDRSGGKFVCVCCCGAFCVYRRHMYPEYTETGRPRWKRFMVCAAAKCPNASQ